MAGIPEASPRCSGANVLDRSRRFGADVLALPINAHVLALSSQPSGFLAFLAWHRRTDRILALTSEVVTGAATVRIGDLDLLHGRAARAATAGWRRVIAREAQEIHADVQERVTRLLADLPLRSPFDLRELTANELRTVTVRPLPGVAPAPDALFASAALRNLPVPQGAGGAWSIAVRSAEELQAVLPPGWSPEVDADLLAEIVADSPLAGLVPMATLLHADAAVRARVADLALRAAGAPESRTVPSDALQLVAGSDVGWVRLRASLDRALGGHRAFAAWSQPVLTVPVGVEPAADDRMHLLLEEAISTVAQQHGSGQRFTILLDASLLRTAELLALAQDVLRRGRKFNLGLVISAKPDARALDDGCLRSLAGCVLQVDEAGMLGLDHGSGQVEDLGRVDPAVARQGQRYLTTGQEAS